MMYVWITQLKMYSKLYNLGIYKHILNDIISKNSQI